MTPAGSWTALDEVEALTRPDDLRDALRANPKAQRYFDAFPPGSQKIILQWIASVRKPETRAKRIAETVRPAAENLKANHYRQ